MNAIIKELADRDAQLMAGVAELPRPEVSQALPKATLLRITHEPYSYPGLYWSFKAYLQCPTCGRVNQHGTGPADSGKRQAHCGCGLYRYDPPTKAELRGAERHGSLAR